MVPLPQQSGYLARSRLFNDRLFLRVPWKQASHVRNRLQERGFKVIACFDPSDHTAGLEFPQPCDLEKMLETLRTIQQTAPR